MNASHKVAEIAKAHKELNRLLIGAYQANLKYKLTVTRLTANKVDDRDVVGLEIFSQEKLYSDNGDV